MRVVGFETLSAKSRADGRLEMCLLRDRDGHTAAALSFQFAFD